MMVRPIHLLIIRIFCCLCGLVPLAGGRRVNKKAFASLAARSAPSGDVQRITHSGEELPGQLGPQLDGTLEMRDPLVIQGDRNLSSDASSQQTTPKAQDAPDVAVVPWWLYPLVAVGCAILVLILYGNLGMTVALSVLVYVGALSTITLSVKWPLMNHFPYPKLLTTLHFLTGMSATGGILLYRKVTDGVEIPIPTGPEMLLMIVPISMALELSVVANNMALVHSSASFTEIMGSANCVVTMAVVAMLGMPLHPSLTAPAIIVAFGCSMAAYGDIEFSLVGCLLCLMACFLRSIKVALQQKLLNGKARDKFNPVSLLFWIAVPSFVLMALLSLATEGLAPYTRLSQLSPAAYSDLQTAILFSCVNALVLNLAQLAVTKDLGAVGSQLAAQMKMVLVVLGSVALFGEKVTDMEIVGFGMSLLGVYWFSAVDAGVKAKEPVQFSIREPQKAQDK